MSEKVEVDDTFSVRLAALERLVGALESGELSLEEALKAFEEGIGLVRALDEQLNAAERRIEVLTRNESGTLQLRALVEDED